ncbi:MAG: hypothetical protein J6U54_17490 [Clostridiales bacterium]|nr:hypothetical protein [Clostridiales bacterium]
MSNVNGSFLDKNGLTYLWGKLKALIGAKASVDDIYGLGLTIPANADLNSYTTPGVYNSLDGTKVTNTLSNCPITTYGFRLEVVSTISDSSYAKQILIPNDDTGSHYVRRKRSSDWSAWKVFHDSEGTAVDIYGRGVELTANDNIDNLTAGGNYSCNDAANVGPNLGGTVPYTGRFKLIVYTTSGGGTNSARTVQVLIPITTSAYMFMRVRNGSNWCAWGRIDSTVSARQELSSGVDLLTLAPGRYQTSTLAATLLHRPSDWGSIAGCIVDVDSATALAKRVIKLYPVSDTANTINYHYVKIEGPNGFDKWVKYSGTFVADAT